MTANLVVVAAVASVVAAAAAPKDGGSGGVDVAKRFIWKVEEEDGVLWVDGSLLYRRRLSARVMQRESPLLVKFRDLSRQWGVTTGAGRRRGGSIGGLLLRD